MTIQSTQQAASEIRKCMDAISTVIRHPPAVQRGYLVPLLGGGHGLIYGDHGLAKTMGVRALSRVVDLSVKRVDATPDMLPGDLVGSDELTDGRVAFKKGPTLECQLFIFDDANRTNPKTQAAMLQVMEERAHHHGGEMYSCLRPFIVFATQNPRAAVGVFPFPEAMLDRFMVCVPVEFPDMEACQKILRDLKTAELSSEHVNRIPKVMDAHTLAEIQELVSSVVLGGYENWVIEFCRATRPDLTSFEFVREHIENGSSPRGIRDLAQTARALTVMDGQSHVTSRLLEEAALLALRHRVVLNRAGRQKYESVDSFLKALLKEKPPGKNVNQNRH